MVENLGQPDLEAMETPDFLHQSEVLLLDSMPPSMGSIQGSLSQVRNRLVLGSILNIRIRKRKDMNMAV